MITETILMLAIVGLLFWQRSKINFSQLLLGLFLAFLLLDTPMGAPLAEGSVHLFELLRQALNALWDWIAGVVQ